MSFAAALQNFCIPTIPITALGSDGRVILKGHCCRSDPGTPGVCLHEESPHCRTGVTTGDAFQGGVESIEAALV